MAVCLHLSLAVYICLMLFTSASCCLHLPHAVYICLMLFTSASCCLHLPHAVYICLIPFTSASCCLHLPHTVYICLMLFTSASCCLHLPHDVWSHETVISSTFPRQCLHYPATSTCASSRSGSITLLGHVPALEIELSPSQDYASGTLCRSKYGSLPRGQVLNVL